MQVTNIPTQTQGAAPHKSTPVPPGTIPVEPHLRRTLSPNGGPDYQFTGGFYQGIEGTTLIVEHVNEARNAENLAQVTQLLSEAPKSVTKRVHEITVLAQQDEPYDQYFESAYKIPDFQAVAAGGNGTITFFGGKPYSVGTMFHEFAHNLPVSERDWKRATRRDDATIATLAQSTPLSAEPFEIVPDPVRQARWAPRLSPGGLTPYGDGNLGEDIAEAMRLLLSERHFGRSFATAGTGTDAHPLWFSRAYPERTKLLERVAKADLDASDEQHVAA